MRCPVVVGREPELAAVDAAVEAAFRGAGGVLVITGEAGIGKTRLADEAAALAYRRGMRVLRGRSVEGGTQIPFRPLAQALQARVRPAGEGPLSDPSLEPFLPALARIVPQWAPDDVAPSSLLLLYEGVARVLSLMGRDHGATVVLEDLHCADAETHAAVAYLADQLSATRTLCVVTGRTQEPAPGAALLRSLASTHPGRSLRLRRLTRDEVTEVTRHCLGREPDAGFVDALAVRSEGVPLLVEDLLAEASASPERAVDRLPLPATYDAVVQRRLVLLDDNARKVMTAAAAVGPDAPTTVLAAITGLDAGVVYAALRCGVEANLLRADGHDADGLAFRHALVADSILARLLPDERRDVLLRSAAAVEAEFPGLPGEWCERVAGLRERGGDPDEAFRLLMEAGRRALRRGALLTAETTLDGAARLAGVDRWRHMGVGRVLARVLASTGNVVRLRQLASVTLEVMEGKLDSMGTPSRLGDLHLQIARGLVAAGDWTAADEQLRTVERLATAAGDDHLRCTADAISAVVAFERGQHRRATALTSAAEANAACADDSDVIATACRVRARLALTGGDIDGATALLRRAERLARSDSALVLNRVETLVALARTDEATTAALDNVLTAAQVARATEAPLSQVLVEVQRARLHLARFELNEAGSAADRAIEVSRRYGLPTLVAAVGTAAEVAALRGDLRWTRALLQEARSLVGPDPGLRLVRSAVDATLALRSGDLGRVRKALDALDLAPTLDDSGPYAWYAGLRALLATLEGAAPPESETDAGPPVTVAAAFRLLAASIAQIHDDPQTAEAGVARADAFLAPLPWRRHLGRLLVGHAATAAGWESLPTLVGQAAEFFTAADQARLAAACRGVLSRAGAPVGRRGRGTARVPPPLRQAGITTREMDVLLLVSDGLSNTDIAERLHLSVRTVESHVSSTMRKTGALSRAALTALVLRSSAGSSADPA